MSKGLYFITFITGVDQCPLHTKVDAIDPMDAIKTFLTFWYRWKSFRCTSSKSAPKNRRIRASNLADVRGKLKYV